MKTGTAFLIGLGVTIAALLLTAAAGGDKKMDAKMKELVDEREIINVVNTIAIEADRGNWSAVENAFADQVLLDYSSMGAKVETLKPAQIIANWKTVLPGFQATQHAVTNHRVSIKGNEAECFSYVDSIHFLPNESGKNTWRVMGFYNHHLVKTAKGWRVDRMKLTTTLIEGNNDLPKLAAEAVKKQ